MRRRVDAILGELSGGPIDYDDQQYLLAQFAEQRARTSGRFRWWFTILLAVEVPVLGFVATNAYLRLLTLLMVLDTVLLSNRMLLQWRRMLYVANVAGCLACVYLCWCLGADALWMALPVVNFAALVVVESGDGGLARDIDDLNGMTYKFKSA